MLKKDSNTKAPGGNGTNVGHEAELRHMAMALRSGMDPAESKHIVPTSSFRSNGLR